MIVMFELILAFLICMAIGLCIWCVAGSVLLPLGSRCGAVVKLHLQDDAAGLEQELRAISWLRRCGLLCAGVELIDCGLNEEGRKLTKKLAETHLFSLHNE